MPETSLCTHYSCMKKPPSFESIHTQTLPNKVRAYTNVYSVGMDYKTVGIL